MSVIPDITLADIVEKTKLMLGENYRESEPETEESSMSKSNDSNNNDLEDICSMVVREAAQWTNKFISEEQLQEVMNDCWPVIIKSSCIAYLNRGAEGLGSQSELGQQNVYNDWVEFLHKHLMNRRSII